MACQIVRWSGRENRTWISAEFVRINWITKCRCGFQPHDPSVHASCAVKNRTYEFLITLLDAKPEESAEIRQIRVIRVLFRFRITDFSPLNLPQTRPKMDFLAAVC